MMPQPVVLDQKLHVLLIYCEVMNNQLTLHYFTVTNPFEEKHTN